MRMTNSGLGSRWRSKSWTRLLVLCLWSCAISSLGCETIVYEPTPLKRMNDTQACQWGCVHQQIGRDAPLVYWVGEVINQADWEPREDSLVCPPCPEVCQ